MLDMALNSITLFFQGRLFKNIGSVIRMAIIGIIITAAIIVAMHFAGLPLWVSAIIGGAIGGAAQPFLFKDLKYA
ncbi:MAG: hypothetical protein COC00_006775 [Rhizobiales bacterium]|nr:hypothetical protein [Hyphomicrobiales bacterium]